MKYVGELIQAVREETKTLDTSSTNGVPDSIILRNLNWAQDRAVAIISNTRSPLLLTTEEVSIVAGQQAYPLHEKILHEKVLNVEYSATGSTTEFREIRPTEISYRETTQGIPSAYFRVGKSLYFNRPPDRSSSKARITFERDLDTLDLRRGSISSRTLTSGVLSALVLYVGADATALTGPGFLCVNDKDGNPLAYNIPFTSYNSGTGVVTLPAPHTLATGEDVPVGAYVTVGRYSTTHSKLRQQSEKYLIHYASMRLLKIKGSPLASLYVEDLAAMEKEMQVSYALSTRDQARIQIDDPEWFP